MVAALVDAALRDPILIDVRTGAVKPLAWTGNNLLRVPLKDSVMAVADASYLDWPELPETPAELRATRTGDKVQLDWKSYREGLRTEIERSVDFKPWQAVGETAPGQSHFGVVTSDQGRTAYRVRALG